SHASKSYFEDTLSPQSLAEVHPLLTPFQEAFHADQGKKILGERNIHGERCQEFQMKSATICLNRKEEPLSMKASLADGSTLTQEIGPYQAKSFSKDHFTTPPGYKKEDYRLSELLNEFLSEPKNPFDLR